MIKKGVWLLFVVVMAAGCLDEPDCYLLNNNYIGIAFKKIEDGSTDTVTFIGVGVVEPGILFFGDTTLSRLYRPLNYFRDETIFFFETGDSVEFLHLTYVSQAQFVSENCGEKFVLSALRVFEHSFDSVRLVTDTPTREANTINIEIFQ